MNINKPGFFSDLLNLVLAVIVAVIFFTLIAKMANAWTPCTADDPRPQPQEECFPANGAPPLSTTQGPIAGPDPGKPSPAPVAVPDGYVPFPHLTFTSKGVCEQTASDIYHALLVCDRDLGAAYKKLAKKNRRK